MDLIQNHIIWTICRVVVHHIFCFLKWGSKWEILFGAKIGNFPISLKESNTLQSTSLLKPLDEFTIKLISYLLYAVQLCIMYFIYFLHWGSQRGILLCLLRAGGISEPLAHLDLCFWLAETEKSSPLKPLGQMNWYLTGSIYERSCIKFPHFVLICWQIWRLWAILVREKKSSPLKPLGQMN